MSTRQRTSLQLTKRAWGYGLIIMMLVLAGQGAHGQAVVYVDVNVTGGANNGSSWGDAYTNLVFAISATGSGSNIWVAQGTYYPTNGTDRTTTFQFKNGVPLYGGFTNGMGSLGERNWSNHATILSGDIGIAGVDTDNCFHVVMGTSNSRLDGFTIINGYCDVDYGSGAGMYNANATNLTVANCAVMTNATKTGDSPRKGGGMANISSCVTVTNCTFIANTADKGGGMYNEAGSTVTVANCTFRANNSWYNNGGGIYNKDCLLSVADCALIENVAQVYSASGGGIYTEYETYVRATTFRENSAIGLGGAIYSIAFLSAADCIFIENRVANKGGGIAGSDLIVSNGIFAGNSATNGGGIFGAGTLVGCAFIGNSATNGGGVCGTGIVVNCAFAGNTALPNGGGAMYGAGTVSNCTFSGNAALYGGGIFNNSTSIVKNCILWDNSGTGKELFNTNATLTISYTDIEGGWDGSNVVNIGGSIINGGGNINTNPLFADRLSGAWNAAGVYDSNSGKTTLTNSAAAWSAGQHVGKTVIVNINDYNQFYITTNTATTLTIWGNATRATNGAAYQIVDIHEKSEGGRWTPLEWVLDSNSSPCIDSGDPTAPFALEPWPNGHRINMGRYGNTPEASKPYLPCGLVISVH